MMRTVLIYQMGKVASTSIAWGVMHGLRLPNIALDHDADVSGVVHTHDHEAVRAYLRDHGREEDRKVHVISLVRDLLRRTVSAFFQNVSNEQNRYWWIGTEDDILRMTMDELIAEFRARQWRHLDEVIHPWFDRFAAVTGTPVFDAPFPHHRGMWTARQGAVDVAILKVESLNSTLGTLGKWLGEPDLALHDENIGQAKWYGELYREFLQRFTPDEHEIEAYYQCRIARHFYSDEERARQIAFWPRNHARDKPPEAKRRARAVA